MLRRSGEASGCNHVDQNNLRKPTSYVLKINILSLFFDTRNIENF